MCEWKICVFLPVFHCFLIKSVMNTRTMKKAIAFCNCFFQLYSPYGAWYCCAVIFGFLPSDICFASVRANIISLWAKRTTSLLPMAKNHNRPFGGGLWFHITYGSSLFSGLWGRQWCANAAIFPDWMKNALRPPLPFRWCRKGCF